MTSMKGTLASQAKVGSIGLQNLDKLCKPLLMIDGWARFKLIERANHQS